MYYMFTGYAGPFTRDRPRRIERCWSVDWNKTPNSQKNVNIKLEKDERSHNAYWCNP